MTHRHIDDDDGDTLCVVPVVLEIEDVRQLTNNNQSQRQDYKTLYVCAIARLKCAHKLTSTTTT